MPDRIRGVKSDSPEQKNTDDALRKIIGKSQHSRQEVSPEQQAPFEELASNQRPRAMFITCADLRIVPELTTRSFPGDPLIAHNVGNMVPSHGQMNGGVSTAVEYAVLALDVHHIVVCSHSDCGAIHAVLDPRTLGHVSTIRAWLRHTEVIRTVVADDCDYGTSHNTLGVLTEESVVAQLDHLRAHPSVASHLASRRLFIHDWMYDVENTQIRIYDAKQSRLPPLDDEHPVPMATSVPCYSNS